MCGIVGVHLKSGAIEDRLGHLMMPMLEALTSRGPDSTGLAIYRHDLSPGELKYSLRAPHADYPWPAVIDNLSSELGCKLVLRPWAQDAVVVAPEAVDLAALLAYHAPDVKVVGFGRAIEIAKDVGGAAEVGARYGLEAFSGYMGIGHTRMATESAVTTEHSHPFAVAADLALVHNGSFSNHASIRRHLYDQGIRCDTDNDSEVAARFIGARLAGGSDLRGALHDVVDTFDGFFTLLVTTESEFAIVRDSFACKPAVVAESEDYVAVGSEYIALADLPGIETARVFEPMPGEIHVWTR